MRISRSHSDAGQLRSISLYEDENQPFRRQGSRDSSGSEGIKQQEFESRIFRRQKEKQVTFEDERFSSPPRIQHARDIQPYQRPNLRQNRRSWDFSNERDVPPELKNNPLLRTASFHGRDQKRERYTDQHDRRGPQNFDQDHRGNNYNRNYNRQGSRGYNERVDNQRNGYDRRDNYRDIREQYRKRDNQHEYEENYQNGNSRGYGDRNGEHRSQNFHRSQSREEGRGFVSNQ